MRDWLTLAAICAVLMLWIIGWTYVLMSVVGDSLVGIFVGVYLIAMLTVFILVQLTKEDS